MGRCFTHRMTANSAVFIVRSATVAAPFGRLVLRKAHMAEFSDEHLVHVEDAKLHNLNNVSVAFPRGAVVAFTGVSRSGKSSLAFGTIHGEAQRKYLELVAPFARRLIGSAADPQLEIVDVKLLKLNHVSVAFRRGAVVAFTGVSGSGKSSLAFGTIHGEAQREYLESVAPFARRLIGSAVDPQVEIVDGMPPTVALEQRTSAGGSRSDVGTITALSNSLRLLFSRAGYHPEEILNHDYGIAGGRLTAGHFSPYTSEGMCPDCQG